LPAAALDKAKKAIADTFAVILAGAGSQVAPSLLRYVEQANESGASPILGGGRTTSPEMAALVNGTFAHSLDFDDVLSMMPAHPSAVILLALLADPRAAKLPGGALIEAYVIGVEIGGKIGLAITVGHYNRGFHGTGTLAIFGALGALATRYRLDVTTTRTAFGIASSIASGLQRNFGTMTKPLHAGWASRSTLAAVNLARSGFTAA
jgi:2-methylcitrate dehydratase PrpD